MSFLLNGSFVTYHDPKGNPLISLNRDGSVSLIQIDFADGTTQNTAALSGSSVLQAATVTLTAAQIKALHATPVQLVAASGAGKLFMPMGAFLQYKHATVDYTVPVNSRLEIGSLDAVVNDYSTWETSQGQIQVLSGKVDNIDYGGFQMGNTGWGTQVATGNLIPLSYMENEALVIGNTGDELTDGDGTLVVTVYYTEVTLA